VPSAFPRRVHVGDAMIAFRHPVAGAPHHLLAVPRRFVADARVVSEPSRAFWDSFEQWLRGYAPTSSAPLLCITNLGRNQEVGLLHIHVVDTWPEWVDAVPHEEHSPSLRVAVEQAAGRFAGLAKPAFGGSIAVAAEPSEPEGWWAVTRLARTD
jgi:diadenosine tetraphosphate (Ap4A) HIT family hydrolase